MHWNVDQILWALVLAAHLVLLIVLLGRDRSSRFPWFTAAIALSAVRLIADHLLHGKLTTIAFYWQSYATMALGGILSVLVLVEVARNVFSGQRAGRQTKAILKPNGWLGGILVTVTLAAAAVWLWGPWPSSAQMRADPARLPLLVLVLFALKATLFASLLTVQLEILLLAFGRRFSAGWSAHAQQIAVGLSTSALGMLVLQAITQSISKSFHPTSQAQYDRVSHLIDRMESGRSALWLLVLLWWIFWLWRDEPGARPTAELTSGPGAQERATLDDGASPEPAVDAAELG